MTNIITDLEISLTLIILYILFRGYAKNRFNEEQGKSGAYLILILGIILYLTISNVIGIITIIGGLALILIPEKKEVLN